MAKKKPFIEPIPTEYGGVKFRSRLEARWAVFFDFVPNILNWEYEPVTFINKKGHPYTPDFRIHYFGWGDQAGEKFSVLIEIKPSKPTAEYLSFLKELSKQYVFTVYLIWGDFYNSNITSVLMEEGKQLKLNPHKIFCNLESAFQTAANFRFDLEDK